jgi:hypothetical protein
MTAATSILLVYCIQKRPQIVRSSVVRSAASTDESNAVSLKGLSRKPGVIAHRPLAVYDSDAVVDLHSKFSSGAENLFRRAGQHAEGFLVHQQRAQLDRTRLWPSLLGCSPA